MPVRLFPAKTTLVSMFALSLMLPVSGCDLSENHLKIDRTTNSEVQDYRDGLSPRQASFADDETSADSSLPELQSYVSDDTKNLKAMPLVSISINGNVPLREALFELAKQADYDIQLDPRITGAIIFTARNKPFDTVIDRICEIAGLRYKMDEDSLRIELDTPYSKNYKIDYLSFVRKNKSAITTDVGISGSGEGSDAQTGSNFQISSEAEADFWKELDGNIKQILASNAQATYLRTSADPTLTLQSENPVMPPVPPINESSLQDSATGANSSYVSSPVSLPSGTQNTGAVVETNTTATQTAPQASPVPAADTQAQTAAAAQPLGSQAPNATPGNSVLRVESLPAQPTDAASAPTTEAVTPTYSINRQAGIISVYANERVHRQINEYLQEVRQATTSQVLIEAKVLEVQLNDEFLAGIDWSTLGDSLGDVNIGLNLPTPDMNPTNGANLFSASIIGNDFGATVSALSRFGTVRALASPRLTVLNNQPAVLSVARNTVYFELDVTRTTTGSPPVTDTTVDSQIKTVPEGVLINVLPSIDAQHGQVSMQVRPTVTRVDSYVNDPGVSILAAGIESPIPQLNVQEIDSVVRLKSGQAMVMGGLLEDRTTSEQNGVPVLAETPLFGGLFRSQNDRIVKTELVIFLKATILNDAGQTVHNTDRELYKTFGQDRRPFKM